MHRLGTVSEKLFKVICILGERFRSSGLRVCYGTCPDSESFVRVGHTLSFLCFLVDGGISGAIIGPPASLRAA